VATVRDSPFVLFMPTSPFTLTHIIGINVNAGKTRKNTFFLYLLVSFRTGVGYSVTTDTVILKLVTASVLLLYVVNDLTLIKLCVK
jgi:hypothetical protein